MKQQTTKQKQREKNLLIGYELEGIYNRDLIRDTINSYNSQSPSRENLKYFFIETDASLTPNYPNRFNHNDRGLEFITDLIHNKKELDATLKEYKDYLQNGTNRELHECVYFNHTCGTHTHIGLSNKQFNQILDYSFLRKLRTKFFKELKDSEIIPETTKSIIKKHYFRYFAKRTREEEWNEKIREKRKEFNVLSELNEKGLEWRSFNIRDVKTWEEFFEMFRINYECVKYLYSIIDNGYKITQKIKIEIPEYTELNIQEINNRVFNRNNCREYINEIRYFMRYSPPEDEDDNDYEDDYYEDD